MLTERPATCAECGAKIPLLKARSDVRFCGDRCRQRASRKRRRKEVLDPPKMAVSAQQPCGDSRDTFGVAHPDPALAVTAPEYGAESVKVLRTEDDFSSQEWDWRRAEVLASQHNAPVDWLRRAIASCRDAGVNPEYVRRRYLERDGTAKNDEVDEAHREQPHLTAGEAGAYRPDPAPAADTPEDPLESVADYLEHMKRTWGGKRDQQESS